jgi:hypothetical protein
MHDILMRIQIEDFLYPSLVTNVILFGLILLSARRGKLYLRRKRWVGKLKQLVEETRQMIEN